MRFIMPPKPVAHSQQAAAEKQADGHRACTPTEYRTAQSKDRRENNLAIFLDGISENGKGSDAEVLFGGFLWRRRHLVGERVKTNLGCAEKKN